MHLIDKGAGMAGTSAIVGGAVSDCRGRRRGARRSAEAASERVVVVFLGERTDHREEGVTSESLNFAAA